MRSTRTRASRTPEEAVGYAVAHRIRVEVLSALNERSYSSTELARVVHQPLSTVTHHVEELLKAHCIEVAFTKRVRAVDQSFYRGVSMPFSSEEEMESWSAEQRQAAYGLILQNATAEAMASLWAKKISNDPESWLTWHWFNVDDQGRREIMEEQERSWARVEEIEAEANARRLDSGQDTRSIIVTSLGFERSRNTSTQSPRNLET